MFPWMVSQIMSLMVSPLALSLFLLNLLCQFHFLWPDFKLYFPQILINSPLFFTLCISPPGWSDPLSVHFHCHVMTNKSLSSALTTLQTSDLYFQVLAGHLPHVVFQVYHIQLWPKPNLFSFTSNQLFLYLLYSLHYLIGSILN